MSNPEAFTEEIQRDLSSAILDRDAVIVKKLLAQYPELRQDYLIFWAPEQTWLDLASNSTAEIVQAFLDVGLDINAFSGKEQATALSTAIRFGKDDIIQLLLQRGANPNLDRPLISAMNQRKPAEQQLRYVKWLVEHGADVNRLYDLYGDPTDMFSALDWAKKPEVRDYLISVGAKTSDEIKGKAQASHETKKPNLSPEQAVIQYFQDNFGPVDYRSITPTIPTPYPIHVHRVLPNKSKKQLTLFTTGLSRARMNVPKGGELYSWAELFIDLPVACLQGAEIAPQYSWIVEWMIRIAKYPQERKKWLGGVLTIISNGEPPKPFRSDTQFSAWLLVAEKSFVREDGETIQLYRMMPIFKEERDLERKQGAAAIMREFDRQDVPFIVDLNRKPIRG